MERTNSSLQLYTVKADKLANVALTVRSVLYIFKLYHKHTWKLICLFNLQLCGLVGMQFLCTVVASVSEVFLRGNCVI